MIFCEYHGTGILLGCLLYTSAYPIESVRDNKFWINVARVDNTLGDRKLLPTRYGTFE